MPGEDALWTVAHDAQGYLTIARVSDSKVLTVSPDDPASTEAPGVRIELCDPDGTWAQRWIAVAQGEGFVLVSALDATLALDVTGAMDADGASVQLYTRNDTAAQTWSFADPESLEQTSEIDLLAASSRDALPAGTYYIVSSLGSHKVIDVSGGASWDGANVQLYASNGTAAQQWTVSYDANGYATITNKGSGKVLDVAAGKSNPGTNVQQFSSNGTRAQKMGDRAHFGHRQLPHPLRTRPKPRARHLRRLLRQRCQRAGLHGKRHGGSIVHLRLCRPCVGRPL